jgi:iron(III) transport system permease protein
MLGDQKMRRTARSTARQASRRTRFGRKTPWLLTLGATAVVTISLGPLGYLAERAFSLGAKAVKAEIVQDRTVRLIVRSLVLMLSVTTVTAIVGTFAAVAVARFNIPFRRFFRVALALPLSIPTYIAAFTWVAARPSIPPFGAALLVLSLCCFPYVYLPVLAALTFADPAHEEVARSLGATPAAAVRRVVLPQLRNAVAAGSLLVALYVLSDFGAVATVRYEVFTWVIFGAYSAGFNPARAAILSLVLIAVSLLVVAAETKVRRPGASRVGSGSSRVRNLQTLGNWRVPVTCTLGALVGLSVGFPVISLLRWLSRAAGQGINTGEVLSALMSSVLLSLATATLATAAALPIAHLVTRFPTRVSRNLERATFVVHGLPGIVIGISLVYVGTRILRPIYQKTPLLLLAYVVLTLPLAVATTRSAFEDVSKTYEPVARSLSLGPIAAFQRVTFRIALPGVAAGAALVFLATMKELPATILLHPTGMETLATRIWQRTSVSDFGGAAPFASVLVLLSAVATFVIDRATFSRNTPQTHDKELGL